MIPSPVSKLGTAPVLCALQGCMGPGDANVYQPPGGVLVHALWAPFQQIAGGVTGLAVSLARARVAVEGFRGGRECAQHLKDRFPLFVSGFGVFDGPLRLRLAGVERGADDAAFFEHGHVVTDPAVRGRGQRRALRRAWAPPS